MQKHCQEGNYVQNHNNIIRYNIGVVHFSWPKKVNNLFLVVALNTR